MSIRPDIPEAMSGPRPNRLPRGSIVRPNGAVVAPEKPGGHFLAIIGFDGMVSMNTFDACMQAQGRAGIWRGWKCHAGEGQIRARNECIHQFLTTPCSHLLFLDSDIKFNLDHVLALRRHPEAEDHIICGGYAKKQDEVSHCYNSLKGGNPPPNKLGLMEVATAGTGFMQIPRSAFAKIREVFPKRWYDCDYDIREDGSRGKKFSYCFQDVMFDDNTGLIRDMTEDWTLCAMARKAGVKVFIDVTTTEQPWIEHLGRAFYPLMTELQRRGVVDALAEAQAKIVQLEAQLSGKPAPIDVVATPVDSPETANGS